MRRGAARTGAVKRFAQAVLFALASVVLVFAAWEIWLSLEYGTDGPYRIVAEFASPYVHVVAPGTGEANNLSMRRLEDTPETPPPGTFRILSYGDSVGSGYGVAVDGMYAHIVEQKLNERGQRRHEVLTMAGELPDNLQLPRSSGRPSSPP